MAISSVGIGSGIDANSIISQLGSIERQPLQALQTKASTLQTQLSLYGKIKSQVSAFGDAAANLTLASAWSAPKGTSTNSSAVGVTVATGALAASVSVEVTNLARAQSSVTQAMSSTATLSAGTLKLQTGTWSDVALAQTSLTQSMGSDDKLRNGTLTFKTGTWSGAAFTPGGAGDFNVDVTDQDTLSSLADKINAKSGGVTAAVIQVGGKEQLMMRSSTTGAASGFQVTTADSGLDAFKMTDPVAISASSSGMYTSQAAIDANTFTAGATAGKDVTVTATDTLKTLAEKINAAGAGVTASVLQDGSQQRLMLRSASTGKESGFQVTTADSALNAFKMTDSVATSAGSGGMYISQTALDANLKVNGVAITAKTNKITDALPGVSLTLGQVTTTPVELTIENDLDAVKAKLQTMLDAYNTLNTTLSDSTKYDASSKKGAALQGDSMTLSLQSAMRSMLSSTSVGSTAYKTLSDVGVERQTDGSLKLNSSKINAALANMTELKKLFTTDNGSATTNGFGLKIRDFSRGLVAFDGRVSNRTTGIQTSISKNSADQARVNERAERVEASLRRQYSALDSKMSQMSGLSAYVSSQIAQWNKSS